MVRFVSRPVSSLSEVAISLISIGNWVWFTLMPIPIITVGTFEAWYSHRTPAIFLSFSKRSFGHFSFAGLGINSLTAMAVASPAIKVTIGNCSGEKLGWIDIER